MKLISFNFKKISIERIKDLIENLKLETGIDITTIKNITPKNYKGKEEILEVLFKYSIKYQPDIAKLELEGKVILGIDEKQSKEILKEWQNKKIPEEFKMIIFNTILRKASVKALSLEEEMKLPYHIPFPEVKSTENKK
jgi:hypothetical protein